MSFGFKARRTEFLSCFCRPLAVRPGASGFFAAGAFPRPSDGVTALACPREGDTVMLQVADGCGWLSAARKAALLGSSLLTLPPSDFPAAWGIPQLVWSREEGPRAAERQGPRSPGERRSRGSRSALRPLQLTRVFRLTSAAEDSLEAEQKRSAWSAAARSMEKHLRAEDAAWRPPPKHIFKPSQQRAGAAPTAFFAEPPPSSGRVQILQLLCRPRLLLQGLSGHSHPQSKGPLESPQRRLEPGRRGSQAWVNQDWNLGLQMLTTTSRRLLSKRHQAMMEILFRLLQ